MRFNNQRVKQRLTPSKVAPNTGGDTERDQITVENDKEPKKKVSFDKDKN